jgi:UDP-N-acetylmuramoyl-L-alanyl-D-glutamate--2,6-diaminopimelate ligase
MTGTATLPVGARELLARIAPGADAGVPAALAFTDLCSDSRRVVPGCLFLAVAGGRRHGLEFVPAVVAAGAAAIAWDAARPAPALPAGIAGLPIAGLDARVGEIAAAFFASPAHALRVAGITGTNGKTTVAWLAMQAFEALGRATGYMGTLGHGRGSRVTPGQLTTPDCVSFHRQLRAFADDRVAMVCAEVSSHALDQGRVDGVHFPVVAFTNLSRDHLDYHPTLEAYFAAKARLFQRGAGTAVVNVGDAWGRRLAAMPMPGTALLTVALGGDEQPTAALRAQVTAQDAAGITLEIWGDFGRATLASPLWGRFNAENLLLTLGILLAEGYPLARAVAALAGCRPPPGRMEQVAAAGPGPAVIVDFAHTPDALAKALAAVRAHCRGRLWCVFGCGGERDPGKRAPMGAAAAAGADAVVVTSDNPRGEAPDAIIAAILAGIPAVVPVQVQADRAAAIAAAIGAAGPGDVILIAGKGHETYQEVDGQRVPFADAAVARAALEKLS